MLSVLVLLVSVGIVLAALERGLLRGRAIAGLAAAAAVTAVLLARAATDSGFAVAGVAIVVLLAGLVLQEINDTLALLGASRRRSRRRHRPRAAPDWWLPEEARDLERRRERDRLAA